MDFIRSHWKYPEKDIATTFMDINLKDDNGEEVSYNFNICVALF